MTNLLQETLVALGDHTPTDVKWVGSRDGEYGMTWERFTVIAEAIDYDSGYGAHYIPNDLVVVGQGWWLERHEYDGSEWWEYKSEPKLSGDHKPIKKLYDPDEMFVSHVADLNGGDDD